MQSKLIVIAIGGNSLIEDPENVSVASQYESVKKTAVHIARLIKAGHKVVLVHGNGPQVGFVLLRSEYSRPILHGVPLDSCVADTQGSIGYQLQMALGNELRANGYTREVATVVTQVLVDADDPSFANPSKPIGSFMSKTEAQEREKTEGWQTVEDAGRGYRRVVPSPIPQEIVETETIRSLVDAGVIVIAAGGGGIPVVRDADGTLSGKEAVIDKDLAAALLAKQLEADLCIVSTAVDKVYLNWGTAEQVALDEITLAEAATYIEAGHFAPGSMLPKIEALVDFVQSGGERGIITDPANLYDALYAQKGTHIVQG